MSDAWGGSWGTSWALSWTPSGVTPPVVEVPIVGGFWKDELKPKRREHKPNPDRVALRAMLESAFMGPHGKPIREVIAQYREPPEGRRPAYSELVNWDALLNDIDACVKVLRAYEASSLRAKHERRAAKASEMLALIESGRRRRKRMRRMVVRMIVAGAH